MSLENRLLALENGIACRTDQTFQVTDIFEDFNKLIGLPKHPASLQEIGLMPYQSEFIKLIPKDRNRLFHINKSRQIGATELILRVLAFHCFHKYRGGKILIITGTREKTAAKLMQRFKKLFNNIPWAISDSSSMHSLKLTNGTEIEALPSNSEAIRGDTKIKAIFVDEAAHFRLLDDSVVMDAIEPVIFTNKADLFLISTPNGLRGFFYEISKNENEYFKIKWDYTSAIGFIYSKEEINKELQRNDMDIEQEYMCQFTAPSGSVFMEPIEPGFEEVLL